MFRLLVSIVLLLSVGCVTTRDMENLSMLTREHIDRISATVATIDKQKSEEIAETADDFSTAAAEQIAEVEARIQAHLESATGLVDIATKNPAGALATLAGIVLTTMKGVDLNRDRKRRKRGEPVAT